jgi:cytochrome c553/cytochrome c5
MPSLTALAVLLAAAVSSPCPAQEGTDDEPFLPGLVARFRDDRGNTATRLDHRLAFHWGEAAPDPRLVGSAFRVTWEGSLSIPANGDHRFFLFGSGEVELKIAGQVVVARQTLRDAWRESAPVSLAADTHPLELSFRRTSKDARLIALWSGPGFGLEPIPPRALVHPRERVVSNDFERGRALARTLRCGSCHREDGASPPAPALDRLAGNLARSWLVRWLSANEHGRPAQGEPASPRRMPAFGLSGPQAEAVADWLLSGRPADPPASPPAQQPGKKKPKPDAGTGERLFLTLGCLACHTWRDLGASGWPGGGDLTHLADKRPPGFFAAWLADPARLNADHRMPVFPLADDERTSLSLFLAEQKSPEAKTDFTVHAGQERRAEGRRLVGQFNCSACHRLPEALPHEAAPRLGERSDWGRSCVGEPDAAKRRPGYRLADKDARAVRLYYAERRQTADRPVRLEGGLLLAEHNCLACHAREGTREAMPLLPPLLADKLTAVVRHYPDLAPLVPALTPPALNSAGDKLTDAALAESIARREGPHRPYLQVRMPRFRLNDDEVQGIVRHLVDTDRVPERPGRAVPAPDRARQDRQALAGARLVSSDGFGCTSCHAVGHVQPSQTPLNARGPDLSQLGRRIRRPWFDRWVRNPARIVPRMEMPSVQIPVTGVLGDNLNEQLAAVWLVLNQPGFEPPPPNPIRTLRQHGNDPTAEPLVLTDVLRQNGQARLKPFLVGLANRHSVLIDLEAGALAQWMVGDIARQRTQGKAWFWEPAGAVVLDTGLTAPDLLLIAGGKEIRPRPLGQFVTEADAWESKGAGLELAYRLRFPIAGQATAATLHVRRKLSPLPGGFAEELCVDALPASSRLRLSVLSAPAAGRATRSPDGRTLRLGDRFSSRIVLTEPPGATFADDGTGILLTPDAKRTARVVLHYLSDVPVDRFPQQASTPADVRKGEPVEVAPGFRGERLPLTDEIMPTGLSWRPNGRLVFCSLKGQVFEAVDRDKDGTEDDLRLLADGLPAPYGIHAGPDHADVSPDHIDVSVKYGVVRLIGARASRPHRMEVIASGWGYSEDYHDWAVGLPRNERGDYFLGIPCQQDKRSLAAARFHGSVLRLVPRRPTPDDPRLFDLEPISSGHRFPMGLALDRDGELFVTDNQGNYKPFNELNHVRPGAHFGFINWLDRGKPAPPRTPPAIDIPHPWTRSVNGICFLYTPKPLRARLGRDVFGPLEGHLIGCEYDTRRLVRMTLQRVGETYQGAAYPLSIPPADARHGFLGPLVCGVSPGGELYVGGIRDSGWGAGNNVGEIVRIRVEPDKLPCGIAEVRATHDGFTIDFFRPVDRARAGRAENYAIASYRREPTPAYGAPDRDRRTEKVTDVNISADARRVTLRLGEMRPGFVYELRLKNLAPSGGDFYPAEAHYTLHVVPE